MKSLFAVITLAAALTSSFGAEWLTDYDAAKEKAKKENKAILMDFTGSDWCGFCIRLKKNVFNTPEFQKWADENVVLLEVDFPSKKKQPEALKKANAKLKEAFDIEGFPTIHFVTADGKKLGNLVGYGGEKPGAWIAKAEKILAKAKST